MRHSWLLPALLCRPSTSIGLPCSPGPHRASTPPIHPTRPPFPRALPLLSAGQEPGGGAGGGPERRAVGARGAHPGHRPPPALPGRRLAGHAARQVAPLPPGPSHDPRQAGHPMLRQVGRTSCRPLHRGLHTPQHACRPIRSTRRRAPAVPSPPPPAKTSQPPPPTHPRTPAC